MCEMGVGAPPHICVQSSAFFFPSGPSAHSHSRLPAAAFCVSSQAGGPAVEARVKVRGLGLGLRFGIRVEAVVADGLSSGQRWVGLGLGLGLGFG